VLVTHHPSGAALLRCAGAHLEANEAENGLILGLCGGPQGASDARGPGAEECSWISVGELEAPVGVAVRTPPFNLVLSRAPRAALETLVYDLHARRFDLPGVSCPSEIADTFTELWTQHARTPVRTRVVMRQGIYQLTRVTPPRAAPGALRPARATDAALLVEWMALFSADAGVAPSETVAYQKRIPAMIEAGTIFVWDNGAPVSMAFFQGKTPHGIRVSMVFTPRDQRGHGYASACVAAMSAHALASGRRFCMLYTDLANPTSNALYQRIGYELVCESAMIAFES
jgi:uncharacterized protein